MGGRGGQLPWPWLWAKVKILTHWKGLKQCFLEKFQFFFDNFPMSVRQDSGLYCRAKYAFCFPAQRGRLLLWEQRYKSSPGQSHRVMYLSYYFSIIIARQYIRLLARWCIFRDPVQLPKVFFPQSSKFYKLLKIWLVWYCTSRAIHCLVIKSTLKTF